MSAGSRCRLAALALGLSLMVAGCNKPPPAPELTLTRGPFADLAGWTQDQVAEALPALITSCKPLLASPKPPPKPPVAAIAGTSTGKSAAAAEAERGALVLTSADWVPVCAAAAQVPAGDEAAARAFFEANFVPFLAGNHGEPTGTFTGYYEAELHGARQPGGPYTVPLYRRPPDLITVDLGAFRPSLAGEHLAGRVEGSRLVPYPARAEIDTALAGRGLELVWVDSAIDAFFLAVQGSGRVSLAEGGEIRLGYDGENGRPYVAVGKLLAERGVPADQIDMNYIRRWIAEHGEDGVALMNANPSYIFYRILTGPGPVGSQGVALTAGRSAAVDRRFLPLGVPLWVSTSDPVAPGGQLHRLFIAQDTGGAIRGPVRADLFWGFGAEAADHAGRLKGRGRYWVLVPSAAAARLSAGSPSAS